MKRRSVSNLRYLAAVGLISACGFACNKPSAPTGTAPAKSVSTLLAEIPAGQEVGDITFSSDGRRVAYVAKKDGRQFVVLDKTPGKPYDVVYEFSFSPDGTKTAYGVGIGEKDRLVVADGREGPEYQDLGKPTFSPDGRILAYEAQRGEKYVLVVGGKETAPFDMPYGPPLFSADSARIAYIEQHYASKKNNLVVSNADLTGRKRGKDYDRLTDIRLSKDRSLLAYIAQQGAKKHLVTADFRGTSLEEREGSPYDDIAGFALSDDGRHVVYVAKKAGRALLVRDGREEPYPAAELGGGPFFIEKGEQVASIGVTAGKMSLVTEGKPGAQYDEIGMPAFSREGTVAYPARKGTAWYLVVNGRESATPYDMIVTPQFAPDGSRVVARVRKEGKRFVAVADAGARVVKELPRYEMVWQPVFATDGCSIGYGVKNGSEIRWIVEPLQ